MSRLAWLPGFALWASPFAAVAQEAVPEDFKSLFYLREETVQWYVPFGLESDGQWAPRLLGLDPNKQALSNRVSAAAMLKPGDLFFSRPPMENRFKFSGIIEKEVMNPQTRAMERVKIATFEDLQPNKKELKYESQQGLPEKEISGKAYYDRTAVFSFEAEGEDPVEFKVEELTHFALPPGAAAKRFFLKELSKEKAVVDYKDQAGALRTATIMQSAGEKAKPAAVHKTLVIPKTAEQLAVLEQLEKVKLTPKVMKEHDLAKVLHALNQAGTRNTNATGVINFVIRGSSDGGPEVTLPEKETNYAAALDDACKQAGFRWVIELAESGPPLLVLFHKDERQSGKKGGDGDAALEPGEPDPFSGGE